MGQVIKQGELPESIFDVLSTEHRDVEALFEQIEVLCEDSPDDAGDLFAVLRTNLLAHARTEAEVVYPRFARIKPLESTMREAVVEHHVVETLLGELAGQQPDGQEWLAELVVLKEMVKHHVTEEEGEIFETAREHLEAADAQKLAAEYLRRKERATGEPELMQAAARKPGKKPGLLARLLS